MALVYLTLYIDQWFDLESGPIYSVFHYSYNFRHLKEFNLHNISFPVILFFVKWILWKKNLFRLSMFNVTLCISPAYTNGNISKNMLEILLVK